MPMNKTKIKTLARQTGTFKAEGQCLLMYGCIGDWFDELEGKRVVEKIRSMTGDITVKLNSPGGDVFDGIAIMNALKDHSKNKGRVTVSVDALAASIASAIAMAGDEIVMAEGSFLMIHNPYTLIIGDAAEMRKTADVLDQITDSLAGIYANKTGMSIEGVKALMSEETWIDPTAAIEMGFATRLDTEEEAEGFENFDLSVFDNVPEPLKIAAKAARPSTVRGLEKALHNIGFSRAEAKRVAAAGFGALVPREADTGEEDSARLLAALEARSKLLINKGE